nr:hypothetical protein [uncultured Nocardioides sp.]
MQIYLFDGQSHGQRFETEEPFVEGDKVTWTPQGEVSRVAGPFSGGGYIINATVAEVDGVQRRTAVWQD